MPFSGFIFLPVADNQPGTRKKLRIDRLIDERKIGRKYYVPISQLHEYFFCSFVRESMERPSD